MIRRLWLVLCGSVALLVGLLTSAAGAQAAGQPLSAGSSGIPGTQFFGVAAQGDGRLVATGENGTGASAQLIVARFNADGSLDRSFGDGGITFGPALSTATAGRAVAVGSGGNVLVAGGLSNGVADGGMLLERFSTAGRLDSSFGSGGVAQALVAQCGSALAIALQGDGKIVLAGSGCQSPGQSVAALARFTTAGRPDTSFGAIGGAPAGAVLQNLGDFSVAYGVVVDSNSKLVIAGSQRPGGQVPNGLAARFDSGGTLDASFGQRGAIAQYPAGGSGSVELRGVALQGTDIVLAGVTPNSSGSSAIVMRLNAAGQRDASFNAGTPVYLPAQAAVLTQPPPAPYPGAYSVAISGSDIIAGGFALNAAQLDEPALWALGPSGSLDRSFGSGGVLFSSLAPDSGTLGALAISPSDGSILAAGSSSLANGFPSGLAARYSGNPLGGGPPTPTPAPPKPTPTPTPKPPRPPKPPSLSLQRRYSLPGVLNSGLALKVTCHAPCSIRAQLVLPNAAARRLGLIPRRSRERRGVTIGAARRGLRRSGSVTLRLFLSRSARRSLARAHGVRLTLSVVIQSGGARTAKSLGVVLR